MLKGPYALADCRRRDAQHLGRGIERSGLDDCRYRAYELKGNLHMKQL